MEVNTQRKLARHVCTACPALDLACCLQGPSIHLLHAMLDCHCIVRMLDAVHIKHTYRRGILVPALLRSIRCN